MPTFDEKKNTGLPTPEDKKKKVIELYKNSIGVMDISRSENLSKTTVRKILKDAGARDIKRSDIDRSHLIVKNYFAVIDTEQKAYFLGLMYADGNIYPGKNKRIHHTISINLIESDVLLLELFRDCVFPTHPLYFVDINSKKPTQNNQYKLQFNCKEMAEDLLFHGCPPKKSLILKFPTTIPSHLIQHFLRGYIDGDGCISSRVYKNPPNYISYTVSLMSTMDFCVSTKNIMIDLFDIHPTLSLRHTKNNNFITTELIFGGNQQVYRFLSWLYQDATIYLARKHEKFIELQSLIQSEKQARK
jgi:hypothetical protein